LSLTDLITTSRRGRFAGRPRRRFTFCKRLDASVRSFRVKPEVRHHMQRGSMAPAASALPCRRFSGRIDRRGYGTIFFYFIVMAADKYRRLAARYFESIILA
jgi:hypothetical protein